MLIKQALEIMNNCSKDSGDRFDVEYLTFDKKRKTGGELKSLKNCYTRGLSHDGNRQGTIGVQEHNAVHPIPVHVRLIMKLNGEPVY